MLPIAVLDMDTRASESPLRQPDLAHHLIGIDCYALGERAPEPGDVSRARGGVLDGYAAMIVPAMVDQEHLLAHRAVIRRYLDGGGVVVFGPQARHAAAREVPAKAGPAHAPGAGRRVIPRQWPRLRGRGAPIPHG